MLKVKFETEPEIVHLCDGEYSETTLCGLQIGEQNDAIIVRHSPNCPECLNELQSKKDGTTK